MSDVAVPRPPASGSTACLLDAVRVPAAVLADDGHWRQVNPALAALLGATAADLAGTAAHRHVWPEFADRIDDALRDTDAALDAALTWTAADGHPRHLRLTLSALDGGEALLQVEDVTALKTLELMQESLAFGISNK